jgi:ribokinase
VIVVFGSINVDSVARTPHLPGPGETVLGRSIEQTLGGKGANQAIAACRLCGSGALVGRVGRDDAGRRLLAALNDARLDVTDVVVDGSAPTGRALIVVADGGENAIVVVPGANASVGDNELSRLGDRLEQGDRLLLQLELPLPVVQRAAELARDRGARVVLDPAPVDGPLDRELLGLAEVLTPNALEAARLTGRAVGGAEDAFAAARDLRGQGAGTVVVTLGHLGAVAVSDDDAFHQPPFPVEAVDAVAAGDAFNGALAVALDEGRPLREAVRWAAAAGALSSTRPGASGSLPERAELEAFLAAHGDVQPA